MNTQTQRFYIDARIGNRIAPFPRRNASAPRGIGALAAVSGGLFQGRARSQRSVIEQLSRLVSRMTFANAA